MLLIAVKYMKKDGRSISRETLENYRFQALKLRKNEWKVNDIETRTKELVEIALEVFDINGK